MLARLTTTLSAPRFSLSLSRSFSCLVLTSPHNPYQSSNRKKNKMKFQTSVLSVLAFSGYASAFSPAPRGALSTALAAYGLETKGEAGTESFRLGFTESDKAISPWHDIPLKGETEGTYNMVVEIPKMTKAKMEVATKEESNPIAQDIKKGVLRDYHGPIFWNYGTCFSFDCDQCNEIEKTNMR